MNIYSMSYRILLANLLILQIGMTSCKKDFLNPAPSDQTITRDFFTNLSSCEQALNGAYLILSEPFYNGANAPIYGDIIADNIKPVIGGSILAAPYSWAQVPSDFSYPGYLSNINANWSTGYRITRQLAHILENVDRFRMENTGKADDLKGQALAIRALIYFNLVNAFSQPYGYTPDASHPGIPYVIVSDITKGVNDRGTVADVYEKLIFDLTTAVPLLNTQTANKIYFNKLSAQALLARILLFKGDYTGAKNLAAGIKNVLPIMNANYPSKLFTNMETEALFQLLPMQSGLNSSVNTSYPGYYFSPASLAFVATSDIANLLNEIPTDVRKAWVARDGNVIRITKYPSGVLSGFPQPERSYYHTLIRSSEMYLTAAECYAKLNNEDSARWFVNAIRTRAYGAGFETTATGSALLDTIANERRKELAFEGFRMFDLLRNKQGVNRVDVNSPDAKTLPYPSNKAIAPIPTVDVEVSGLKQNEGYN